MTHDIAGAIGPVIRARRKELGLTQRAVARKAGRMAANTVGRLERGHGGTSLVNLEAILGALELSWLEAVERAHGAPRGVASPEEFMGSLDALAAEGVHAHWGEVRACRQYPNGALVPLGERRLLLWAVRRVLGPPVREKIAGRMTR